MRTLCIIQARYASTRLPGKMLFPIGGQSLIARAYAQALRVFPVDDIIIATPHEDAALFKAFVPSARIYGYVGPSHDVLGRLVMCAKSVAGPRVTRVARWTPDDWRKNTRLIHEAAFDEHVHPAAQSIELFEMEALVSQFWRLPWGRREREHVGLLHPANDLIPPSDGLPWSIDTREDYLTVASLHMSP